MLSGRDCSFGEVNVVSTHDNKCCSSLLPQQWRRFCKISAATPQFLIITVEAWICGLSSLYMEVFSRVIKLLSSPVFYSSCWLFAREFPQLMHTKILPDNTFWMSGITSHDIFGLETSAFIFLSQVFCFWTKFSSCQQVGFEVFYKLLKTKLYQKKPNQAKTKISPALLGE